MDAARDLDPAPSEGMGAGSVSGQSDGGLPTVQDDGAPNVKTRKRRAPTHISQNACTNCKKARAKCDGEEPAACSRCRGRGIADHCHYEIHVKTVKEEMIRRIKSLERESTELQVTLREKDRWIESVVNALMDTERAAEAIERLRKGQSLDQLIEWLGQPPIQDLRRLSLVSESKPWAIISKFEAALSIGPRQSNHMPSQMQWTKVTSNVALMHHLMALYFNWIHPSHMLFSERHFTASFNAGDRQYCSPALVNSICAMGCFFLSDQAKDGADARSLAMRFLDQAKQDLISEEHTALTFCNAYAVIFLVEVGAGLARKGSAHLRLAVESLQSLKKSAYDEEAIQITIWGVHTLSSIWSGLSHQTPWLAPWPRSTIFQNVHPDFANAMWRPYRLPFENTTIELPSCAIATAREMAGLNSLVQTIKFVLFGYQGGPVTAKDILELYRKLLQWKERLPEELSAEEDGSRALPHVLHLHLYYHVVVCQLFEPLISNRPNLHSAQDLLKSLINRVAESGMTIYQTYRNLFTSRYQTPLQAFYIVHLSNALLKAGMEDSSAQNAIALCLQSLRDGLSAYSFSGPLQALICESAVGQGYARPSDVETIAGIKPNYHPEELLDACERVTLLQSFEMIVDNFDESFGEVFLQQWQDLIERHGGGNDVVMGDGPNIRPRFTKAAVADALGIDDGVYSPAQRSDASSSSRSMQITSLVNP